MEWKDAFPSWTAHCNKSGKHVHRGERKFFVVHVPGTNKSAPVVFLIHGLGGRSEQWNFQIDNLVKEGFEIVVPDLIGHARASKPTTAAAYQTELFVQDIEYLVNSFANGGKDRPVYMVGHSMGAALSALVCARANVRVAKLALLGTGFTHPSGTRSLLWRCCSPRVLTWIRPIISRATRHLWFHPKTDAALIERQKSISDQNPMYVMQNLCNGLVWPTAADFARIDQRVLIVSGDHDKIFVARESDELEYSLVSAASVNRYLIQTAGHIFTLEQPVKLSECLCTFLSGDVWVPPP